MKTKLALVAVCLFGACLAEQVPLWPENKMPLQTSPLGPDKMAPIVDDCMRLSEVTTPSLLPMTVKTDPDAESVPAVIVCPGGGYRILAWDKEGTEIGRWLNAQNVSAFILKYRVPGCRDAAYADAQRAVSWVRANAVRFNVSPDRIGIIGFSAGANLAARVSTGFKKRSYATVDATDAVSCRPDFTLLVYPWALVKETKDASGVRRSFDLKDEYPVCAETPPAFVVQSADDSCGFENALAWQAALTRAHVSCTLHVFDRGGHGYGLRSMGAPTDAWASLAEMWLVGFLGE